MTGARAIAAAAIGDAGVRDLASEWSGPRLDAVRGEGRGRGAGALAGARSVRVQAGERVVRVRRG